MTAPLAGVRVVEVATHVYVPMSGGVLADYGADVIRVEQPGVADPLRGLVTQGFNPAGSAHPLQPANRGKRSVALDLKHPEGRSVLSRLLATADVFVTSLRESAIRRRKVDLEAVRADNPQIIYVRGTAFGSRGPDADRGGYDSGAYWARSAMQQILTPPDQAWPMSSRPAFGDVVGGLTIAGAIGIALYRRAVTGEPSVLDTSLLASGMWQVQTDLVAAYRDGPGAAIRRAPDRHESANPLMLPYRTSDGHVITLQLLTPDRYWPELCKVVGHPDMAADPRFTDVQTRAANARECVEWLDGVFAAKTLAEWRLALADFDGQWVTSALPDALREDPQVKANGYFVEVDMGDGTTAPVVAPPVQFDGAPAQPGRSPEHGEHTETVLLELGLSWDEIGALKDARAIL